MKMKLIACFYIFLIICSMTFTRKEISSLLNKIQIKGAESNLSNGAVALGAVGACMKAFMSAIPPTFCWKRPEMLLKIPKNCPQGYFRSLALCYELCSPGYRHVLGICWQDCPSGYSDHGATCFKNLLHWFWKSSYVPKSVTNFSDQVTCDEGYEKVGPICKISCKKVFDGYVDCGLACAGSQTLCGAEIGKMVFDSIVGIASFVSFILTVGGSSLAAAPVKTALDRIGQSVVNIGLNVIKRAIKKAPEVFIKRAKDNFINNYLKDQITNLAIDKLSDTFCDSLFTSYVEKIKNEKEDTPFDKVLSLVDVIDLRSAIDNCKEATKIGTYQQNLECAKSVLSTVSNFDPTGLLGIATTFMHPICEKPNLLPDIDKNQVDDDSIILYSECFFSGTSKKEVFKNPNKALITSVSAANFKSWKLGKNIIGYQEFQDEKLDLRVYRKGEDELCVEKPVHQILMLNTNSDCILIGKNLHCIDSIKNENNNLNYEIPENAEHKPLKIQFIHPNIKATFYGISKDGREESFTITRNENLCYPAIGESYKISMKKISRVEITK